MDSLITGAARALTAGDPLGALDRVALREDPPALALRGIAMARLGDLDRARLLLRRAAKGFGPREAAARARCVLAEAEIALASRDLGRDARELDGARSTLEAHGDLMNASHARLLQARRLLLIGRLQEAELRLAAIDPAALAPASRAVLELAWADLAIRRLQTHGAGAALDRAEAAAKDAGIAELAVEARTARQALVRPAARRIGAGGSTPLLLEQVEALRASKALIVDACRYSVGRKAQTVALASRPVLFALARALAEAWPQDVPREALVARAFGGRTADESHRARLRVEIGRLRALLGGLADIVATDRGFALQPASAEVVVLAWPVEEKHAPVLALLSDGEAWSSSALALALGMSQRNVQRALEDLAAAGKAEALGQGRARRWTTPPPVAFTTTLLLPARNGRRLGCPA